MALDPKEQSDLKQETGGEVPPVDKPVPNLGENINIPLDNEIDMDIIQNENQDENKEAKIKPDPEPEQGAVENAIRRIRTYKEDIAEAVRTQKASLSSMTAAEQDRRILSGKGVTEKPPIDYKKVGMVVGSVVLTVLGIGVIGFFVFFYEGEEVVVEQEIPSFFFVEEQKEVNITGKNAREILQTLEAEKVENSLSLGQMTQLYVTETIRVSEEKVTRFVSAEEFLKALNAPVGGAFLRSLDPSFMLGVHVFDQNQPFIILESNSYQHSFSGLLEWERTIYNDLFLFTGRRLDPELGVLINPQTGEELVLKDNFEAWHLLTG